MQRFKIQLLYKGCIIFNEQNLLQDLYRDLLSERLLLELSYNAFCFEKTECSVLLCLKNFSESHTLGCCICPSEKMLITIEKFKVNPGYSSHILSKGPESVIPV